MCKKVVYIEQKKEPFILFFLKKKVKKYFATVEKYKDIYTLHDSLSLNYHLFKKRNANPIWILFNMRQILKLSETWFLKIIAKFVSPIDVLLFFFIFVHFVFVAPYPYKTKGKNHAMKFIEIRYVQIFEKG